MPKDPCPRLVPDASNEEPRQRLEDAAWEEEASEDEDDCDRVLDRVRGRKSSGEERG